MAFVSAVYPPRRAPQITESCRVFVPLLLGLSLGACRSPATQVELFVGTDVAPERTMQLRIVAFRGAVESTDLPTRIANPVVMDRTFTRGAGMGEIALPGSFGILPQSAGETGPVTVWLRATVARSASSPQVELDRVMRFGFVRNARGTARVFLPIRCGDQAVGCTSTTQELCTVSTRCREQGATCGDNGECVALEVPVQIEDSGVVLDAPTVGVDATVVRADVPDVLADGVANMDADGSQVPPDAAVPDVPNQDSADVPTGLLPARQLSPLSTSTVTQRQPTMRFTPSPMAMSHSVQFCRDRACTQVNAAVSSDGTARPPSPLAPGWSFWRVIANGRDAMGQPVQAISPVWQFWVPRVSATTPTDRSFGTVPDYNGDGITDALIGAPNANGLAGALTAGEAVFTQGSAMGIGAINTITYGAAAGDRYGQTVRSVSDINGDGFGDVLVGANFATAPGGPMRSGTATIYFGSATGTSARRTQLLVGPSANEAFGTTASSAGDVNGDGYADVLIGAPFATVGANAHAGRVSLFLGSAMGLQVPPQRVFEGQVAEGFMGTSVADAGDVNGDGFGDVLIVARSNNDPMSPIAAALRLYLGSATGTQDLPDLTQFGTAGSGSSLSGAVDYDNDGLSDFVTGSPAELEAGTPRGATRLYFGRVGGSPLQQVRSVGPLDTDPRFGASVSMVPDVDGDGCGELLVSANQATSNRGRAWLYYGNAMRMVGNSTTLEGQNAGDYFGSTVAGAGDLNNDGYGDALVYAQWQTHAGVMFPGNVRVYYGSPVGLSPIFQREFFGAVANEAFGRSLARWFRVGARARSPLGV